MKTGYLTIDDGPSADWKVKADFLLSKKIPAVWFCTGKKMEKRPEAVVYLIKHGFVIGSHAYDHPKFSQLPLKECFEQLRKTDEIIDALYEKAGVERPAKFLRFPYGDKGGGEEETDKGWPPEKREHIQAIQDFLKKLGYRQPKFKRLTYGWYLKAGLDKDVDTYWTYDVMEWSTFQKKPLWGIDSLEKVLERMDEDMPEGCRGINFAGSNDIIMVHDHALTTSMFVPIIEKLLSKGIRFALPE